MGRNCATRLLTTLLVVSAGWSVIAQDLALPNRPDSVKFAAMGDNGTGDQLQYDVATEMNVWHGRFPFDLVLMLGDNVYGGQKPADFLQKFERPYKALLDAGVHFYASLGNHDDPTADIHYPFFDMDGQRYYTYARGNVRFFVIDSNVLDPRQLAWLDGALKAAAEPW